MNVETITMDRDEARAKLRATRARLHRAADEEYRALEDGYKAIAEGTPLIHLGNSVRLGGLDADRRPRFAVARADQRRVDFEWSGSSVVFSTPNRRRHGWSSPPRGAAAHHRRFAFDFSQHPNVPGYGARQGLSATTLVPMVPPDIRVQDPGALSKRAIIWEVEEWTPVPPRDPLLLKHIGGDLWAVTGAWDLTELERAVMAGRRNG